MPCKDIFLIVFVLASLTYNSFWLESKWTVDGDNEETSDDGLGGNGTIVLTCPAM